MSLSAFYTAKVDTDASQISIDVNKSAVENYANGRLARFDRYNDMYEKATETVDMIQKYRTIDRKAILIGAIHDTGNPSGTAINLALNAKTVADKKICKRVMKEWSGKARKQLFD